MTSDTHSLSHHGLRHHLHSAVSGAVAIIHKNTVLTIAILIAVITSVIVPPDAKYLSYVDFKLLICLFSTLAVICALRNIGFFSAIACKTVALTGNLRIASLALIYITFIGSMIIANDMALLTFLPLGYYVLHYTSSEKYMARLFVLQNISANLGGMLTPFGNPQNIYLYNFYNIGNLEFMKIMAIPFAVAVLMLTLSCLLFPTTKLSVSGFTDTVASKKRAVFYSVLFIAAILMFLKVLPYAVTFPLLVVCLLFTDRSSLKKVDYALLLTFFFFFIAAGNLSRIPALSSLLSGLLQKNTLLYSIISCQFISNVPSAILLSNFTDNYKALLIGVNIGGTGTLIASLASLITFRSYVSLNKNSAASFLKTFTVFSFSFLIILYFVSLNVLEFI